MAMTAAFVVAAVVVAIVVVVIVRRPRHTLFPERLVRVHFDDRRIVATFPGAGEQTVAWNDLTRFAIRTTDEGPARADVFWEFHAGSEAPALAFPGGAAGEQELLRALDSHLDGVRWEEFTNAMGSTSNRTFVVWERDGTGPQGTRPLAS